MLSGGKQNENVESSKNKPSDPFNITISDINTYNIDRFIDYANKNGMKKEVMS